MPERRLTEEEIDEVIAGANSGGSGGSRDAGRERLFLAIRQVRAERGADTGYNCVYCGARIFRMMVGAGDGTGQRFAHFECSLIRDLHQAEAERVAAREQVEALRAALVFLRAHAANIPEAFPREALDVIDIALVNTRPLAASEQEEAKC